MLIRLGYEIAIESAEEMPVISLLELAEDRQKDVRRQTPLLLTPNVASQTYRDLFGNRCRRFVAPAGCLTLLFDAVVEDSGLPDPVQPYARQVPVENLPPAALSFLIGSRYCETDQLSPLAWRLFGGVPEGWARVQAICDHVHERLVFGYGHACATRTAAQAHEERVGVCRDFAHLAIALCRAMNIPARYVTGYLGDIGVEPDPAPMDFSAWFEAFLDGKWHAFDARHNTPRIGRVPVARGRDAADVPILHSFGPHRLKTFKVWTYQQDAQPVAAPRAQGERGAALRMVA